MNTIYLDPAAWDITLDSFGNIALASDPYSLAQDAASQIKTFYGEVYYDTTQGIHYFSQILGHGLPLELIRTAYTKAALQVPEVQSVQVFFTGYANRQLTGQVQVHNPSGTTVAIGF